MFILFMVMFLVFYVEMHADKVQLSIHGQGLFSLHVGYCIIVVQR